MRNLSLNFLKTLAIILSSSLLFDFNLAFGIALESPTINGEEWWKHNGVKEGEKVRLKCQIDNWYIHDFRNHLLILSFQFYLNSYKFLNSSLSLSFVIFQMSIMKPRWCSNSIFSLGLNIADGSTMVRFANFLGALMLCNCKLIIIIMCVIM
jgi:hypothetical protein